MDIPYLENLTFSKTRFKVDSTKDHEHCELCWAKMSEYPDDLHEAYTANQGKIWICPECYEKYSDLYHWKLIM